MATDPIKRLQEVLEAKTGKKLNPDKVRDKAHSNPGWALSVYERAKDEFPEYGTPEDFERAVSITALGLQKEAPAVPEIPTVLTATGRSVYQDEREPKPKKEPTRASAYSPLTKALLFTPTEDPIPATARNVQDPELYVQATELQNQMEVASRAEKALADVSAKYGEGILELTNRALAGDKKLTKQEVDLVNKAKDDPSLHTLLYAAEQGVDPTQSQVYRHKYNLFVAENNRTLPAELQTPRTYASLRKSEQVEEVRRLVQGQDKFNKLSKEERALLTKIGKDGTEAYEAKQIREGLGLDVRELRDLNETPKEYMSYLLERLEYDQWFGDLGKLTSELSENVKAKFGKDIFEKLKDLDPQSLNPSDKAAYEAVFNDADFMRLQQVGKSLEGRKQEYQELHKKYPEVTRRMQEGKKSQAAADAVAKDLPTLSRFTELAVKVGSGLFINTAEFLLPPSKVGEYEKLMNEKLAIPTRTGSLWNKAGMVTSTRTEKPFRSNVAKKDGTEYHYDNEGNLVGAWDSKTGLRQEVLGDPELFDQTKKKTNWYSGVAMGVEVMGDVAVTTMLTRGIGGGLATFTEAGKLSDNGYKFASALASYAQYQNRWIQQGLQSGMTFDDAVNYSSMVSAAIASLQPIYGFEAGLAKSMTNEMWKGLTKAEIQKFIKNPHLFWAKVGKTAKDILGESFEEGLEQLAEFKVNTLANHMYGSNLEEGFNSWADAKDSAMEIAFVTMVGTGPLSAVRNATDYTKESKWLREYFTAAAVNPEMYRQLVDELRKEGKLDNTKYYYEDEVAAVGNQYKEELQGDNLSVAQKQELVLLGMEEMQLRSEIDRSPDAAGKEAQDILTRYEDVQKKLGELVGARKASKPIPAKKTTVTPTDAVAEEQAPVETPSDRPPVRKGWKAEPAREVDGKQVRTISTEKKGVKTTEFQEVKGKTAKSTSASITETPYASYQPTQEESNSLDQGQTFGNVISVTESADGTVAKMEILQGGEVIATQDVDLEKRSTGDQRSDDLLAQIRNKARQATSGRTPQPTPTPVSTATPQPKAPKQSALKKAAERASRVLTSLGANVEFVVHESLDEMQKATGHRAAHYDGSTGRIHLAEGMDATRAVHESWHPVLNHLRETNRPVYDRLVKFMSSELKKNPYLAKKIGAFANLYKQAGFSEDVQTDEALTEFLTQAATNPNYLTANGKKSLAATILRTFQKFRDWFPGADTRNAAELTDAEIVELIQAASRAFAGEGKAAEILKKTFPPATLADFEQNPTELLKRSGWAIVSSGRGLKKQYGDNTRKISYNGKVMHLVVGVEDYGSFRGEVFTPFGKYDSTTNIFFPYRGNPIQGSGGFKVGETVFDFNLGSYQVGKPPQYSLDSTGTTVDSNKMPGFGKGIQAVRDIVRDYTAFKSIEADPQTKYIATGMYEGGFDAVPPDFGFNEWQKVDGDKKSAQGKAYDVLQFPSLFTAFPELAYANVNLTIDAEDTQVSPDETYTGEVTSTQPNERSLAESVVRAFRGYAQQLMGFRRGTPETALKSLELESEQHRVDVYEIARSGDAGYAAQFSLTEEQQDIKVKALADGTFMKAPNGKPTNLNELQWLQVRTKPFKNWFGPWDSDPKRASQVVDENGEPLVVYRGDTPNKSIFTGKEDPSTLLQGNIFFSDNKFVARGYQKDGRSVYNKLMFPRESEGSGFFETFLNIRSPKKVNAKGRSWLDVGIDDLATRAQTTNDGLIVTDVVDQYGDGTQFVAFSPTQIKSATSNIGTFDINNPDIRFSLAYSDALLNGHSVQTATEAGIQNVLVGEYRLPSEPTQFSLPPGDTPQAFIARERELFAEALLNANKQAKEQIVRDLARQFGVRELDILAAFHNNGMLWPFEGYRLTHPSIRRVNTTQGEFQASDFIQPQNLRTGQDEADVYAYQILDTFGENAVDTLLEEVAQIRAEMNPETAARATHLVQAMLTWALDSGNIAVETRMWEVFMELGTSVGREMAARQAYVTDNKLKSVKANATEAVVALLGHTLRQNPDKDNLLAQVENDAAALRAEAEPTKEELNGAATVAVKARTPAKTVVSLIQKVSKFVGNAFKQFSFAQTMVGSKPAGGFEAAMVSGNPTRSVAQLLMHLTTSHTSAQAVYITLKGIQRANEEHNIFTGTQQEINTQIVEFFKQALNEQFRGVPLRSLLNLNIPYKVDLSKVDSILDPKVTAEEELKKAVEYVYSRSNNGKRLSEMIMNNPVLGEMGFEEALAVERAVSEHMKRVYGERVKAAVAKYLKDEAYKEYFGTKEVVAYERRARSVAEVISDAAAYGLLDHATFKAHLATMLFKSDMHINMLEKIASLAKRRAATKSTLVHREIDKEASWLLFQIHPSTAAKFAVDFFSYVIRGMLSGIKTIFYSATFAGLVTSIPRAAARSLYRAAQWATVDKMQGPHPFSFITDFVKSGLAKEMFYEIFPKVLRSDADADHIQSFIGDPDMSTMGGVPVQNRVERLTTKAIETLAESWKELQKDPTKLRAYMRMVGDVLGVVWTAPLRVTTFLKSFDQLVSAISIPYYSYVEAIEAGRKKGLRGDDLLQFAQNKAGFGNVHVVHEEAIIQMQRLAANPENRYMFVLDDAGEVVTESITLNDPYGGSITLDKPKTRFRYKDLYGSLVRDGLREMADKEFVDIGEYLYKDAQMMGQPEGQIPVAIHEFLRKGKPAILTELTAENHDFSYWKFAANLAGHALMPFGRIVAQTLSVMYRYSLIGALDTAIKAGFFGQKAPYVGKRVGERIPPSFGLADLNGQIVRRVRSNQEIGEQLILTTATQIAALMGLAAHMFDWDDEEGLVLKEDRKVDVTFQRTGNYQSDRLTDPTEKRLSIKHGESPWVSYRYAMTGIPAFAPVGMLRDRLVYGGKVDAGDMMWALTLGPFQAILDQTFAQSIQTMFKFGEELHQASNNPEMDDQNVDVLEATAQFALTYLVASNFQVLMSGGNFTRDLSADILLAPQKESYFSLADEFTGTRLRAGKYDNDVLAKLFYNTHMFGINELFLTGGTLHDSWGNPIPREYVAKEAGDMLVEGLLSSGPIPFASQIAGMQNPIPLAEKEREYAELPEVKLTRKYKKVKAPSLYYPPKTLSDAEKVINLDPDKAEAVVENGKEVSAEVVRDRILRMRTALTLNVGHVMRQYIRDNYDELDRLNEEELTVAFKILREEAIALVKRQAEFYGSGPIESLIVKEQIVPEMIQRGVDEELRNRFYMQPTEEQEKKVARPTLK